jgi:hypothetical protein
MSAWGAETTISDQGSQLVACFREQLHAPLNTHLIHSSTYHPQIDSQTERVNQIMEDMLRACVMEYQGNWDMDLPWPEFSYNSNYQESLKWWYHTPLKWIKPREKVIFGPDINDEAEAMVHRIQDNLKATK